MENCSPFTSLFRILAAALPISFTAVAIALTDGPSAALHGHNARNPDITQYPERVRGDTCCSFTDTPVHRVTGRQVCGLKARGRFVRLDMNDTSKDMSIFFPAERTEDWKNPLKVIYTIIYQSSVTMSACLELILRLHVRIWVFGAPKYSPPATTG